MQRDEGNYSDIWNLSLISLEHSFSDVNLGRKKPKIKFQGFSLVGYSSTYPKFDCLVVGS